MIHPDATRDECLDEIGFLERQAEQARERYELEIEHLHSQIADLERALAAPCPHCGERP